MKPSSTESPQNSMKKLLIAVAVVALLALYYSESGAEKFSSKIMPISFSYPQDYIVTEKVDTITIMLKEDYQSLQSGEREGGEGPATISIRVVDNPNNPGPRTWAEQYPQQSNYNLRTSGVAEVTVSGLSGISYSADGLYPNRNIVFATDSRLFYINGSYMDEESPLYRDFGAIVESIAVE